MPKTLMFAKLADDEDLSDEAEGRYLRRPAHELEKLFTRLDVPDLGTASASIPDLWAQPLRFQQALLTEDTAARAEWRGLLAFYVLRGQLGAGAKLVLYPVFEPATEDDTSTFLAVARTLLPDKLTEVEVGWESVHLLLFNGRVIGCTSPLTFLSPPATPPLDLVIPNCTWFSKGKFSDPIPSLVGERLLALREWLFEAQSALSNNPPEKYRSGQPVEQRMKVLDAVRADRLRFELSTFIKEIDDVSKKRVSQVAPRISILQDGKHALKGVVQSFLSYAPVVTVVGGYEGLRLSSFLLQSAPGVEPVPPILVISRDFCNLKWCDQGRLEVFGGMNLIDSLAAYEASANDKKSPSHDKLGQSLLAPGRVFEAAEIFTDWVFYAAKPGAFPGAFDIAGVEKMTTVSGSGITPILPLRSDFAAHFSAEYLRENVTLSGDSEKIVVRFNIQLNADGASRGEPIPISKTFTRDNILTGNIPEVSIWPEYDATALPGWKTWFTFYDDLSLPKKLVVTPVHPLGGSTVRVSTDIVDMTDTTKKITVHEGDAFPEKLFCKVERDEVGVLLPKSKDRREAPHVELWKVGIDFGTTGSSVFYRSGSRSSMSEDNLPKVLPLKPHLLLVSNPTSTETYRFFLPCDLENVAGILSVFRDFRPIKPNMEIVPLRDGNICLQEFVDGETGISANMKWGNSAERARAKSFLKQLCLMTALQARVNGAEQLEWVFSYPLSFAGYRVQEFVVTWKESCTFALGASGYDLPDESFNPLSFNESTCAAMYASKVMMANLGDGALILDIGGGSSDIAIWASRGEAKNGTLLNASVKLGGRDVFQRPLLRGSRNLLHMLGIGDAGLGSVGDSEDKPADDTLAFSKLDFLFKRKSEEAGVLTKIMSKLDNARNEPDAIAFSKLLMLAIQGLFYYSGLLLRQKQEEAPEGTRVLDGILPDVYVCGNGSKIFPWLGLGNFSGEVQEKLLQAFAAGAGSAFSKKPTASIHLSRHPKTEAAFGMLLAKGSEVFKPQRIISGEAFQYHDREFAPTDVVPYELLKDAIFTVPKDLPGLSQALREIGIPALSSKIADGVHKGLDSRFKAIAGSRAGVVTNHDDREEEQPIFIMELLELISLATKDWKHGVTPWW